MLRTIKLYEDLSYFEASDDLAAEIAALQRDLQIAKGKLGVEITKLVSSLQRQILNDKLPGKTGFFNGVHKWWKNLFGGHNDRTNPYYWQNKVGALGRTDLEPSTVEEYRMLNGLATSLAEAIDSAPQPLITKILNNWSQQLKSVIGSALDDMIDRVGKMGKRVSKGSPEAPKAPEAPISEPESTLPPTDKAKRLTAPIDDDEDDLPPVKAAPTALPADPETEESLDAIAAKLGIDPDMSIKDFGKFGKLPPATKRFVINACKETAAGKPSPHCPTRSSSNPLKGKTNDEIRAILDKHTGKSAHRMTKGLDAIDPEEQAIIKAVYEPWTSLTDKQRADLNVDMTSRSRFISDGGVEHKLPFRVPPVLKQTDPRYNILQKYYGSLFSMLAHKGRLQKPGETEEEVAARIKAHHDGIEKLRKTKEDNEKKKEEKEKKKAKRLTHATEEPESKRVAGKPPRRVKEIDDEDDVVDAIEKFKPENTTKKGKALLEALKLRLRHQREA